MNALLKILLVSLSILFITLQSLDYYFYAFGVKAFILIGLFVLYLNVVKKKRFWFGMFLSTFTLAELLNFVTFKSQYIYNDFDMLFMIINFLYIISFTFLIAFVLLRMNYKEIIKKYTVHIVVLLIMNIFCVVTVTNTTAADSSLSEYVLLFVYYAVVMSLLSVAFINFLYWDDQKSMNFLIGTIFLVFSEVVQITYYTIAEIKFLNVIWSILLILAFLFFYLQAIMERGPKIVDYEDIDFGESKPENKLT